MRVLIVNKSERIGGAAVASGRLLSALNNNGEKAKMLVCSKQTDDMSVAECGSRLLKSLCFLWERIIVFIHLHFKKDHLWEIDIANSGIDITKTREFKEADVIHFAWVNQGMLSMNVISKIARSGKPIVWTMHDLWPATSICHYARGCEAFKNHCQNCPLLPNNGSKKDLSYSVWEKKKNIYSKANIHFVTCSKWLEKQARQSVLLTGKSLTSIPNPIDTNIFNHQKKSEARKQVNLPEDKNIILFVSQKVTDERKGARFLVEAINRLKTSDPALSKNTVVALLGGHAEELAAQIAIPVYPLGYVSGERNLAKIYNCADVFVLPSLEDNLPNTIMEALACGIPCIGFNVGGIPEMIDHKKNGYIAKEGDTEDLSNGISWVLKEADRNELEHNAITKVAHCYSQQSVAQKYIEVYTEAMAERSYRL